ncbi:MAG: GntR family transcriptional regulator [Acidobacteria bacterium]|nr:GntR family transcriptional regulator [Acidobacteriota bacterium]
MAPTLRIDTRDPRPIWRQIEEGITSWVASGTLVAGEAVPSVRDMARELRVNPATVAKAYQRLVDAGLLETRRGEGTFVREGPPELTREERRKQLVDAATRLATVAAALGATRAESIAALDAARARLEAEHEEGG